LPRPGAGEPPAPGAAAVRGELDAALAARPGEHPADARRLAIARAALHHWRGHGDLRLRRSDTVAAGGAGDPLGRVLYRLLRGLLRGDAGGPAEGHTLWAAWLADFLLLLDSDWSAGGLSGAGAWAMTPGAGFPGGLARFGEGLPGEQELLGGQVT